MKIHTYSFYIVIIIFFAASVNAQSSKPAPYLNRKTTPAQLVVDGKPFLVLGGELGNSTASSVETMRSVWPHLQAMQLNTVLVPVYWELMEPRENVFDFTLIDDHIQQARKHNLKIVFLWFGTWKNSMSCYAPAWVKTNAARFERATDAHGKPVEILSAFGEASLQADKQAFAALMKHIKQTDEKERTVIMIQVENEIGMLGTARETTVKANAAFNQPVPAEMIDYLENNKATLLPELRSRWEANGSNTNGNWQALFGEGLATDELFQAWYYARYTNAVAAAGKAQYNIPMYVNAALFRKEQQPGNYPSAGPLPQVMEVWQCAAPAIDILSPDFYNPNTEYWCDLYSRKSNPLFIPEMRFEPSCGAKALYIFGHYNALSFSPFSIESRTAKEEEPLKNGYDIIRQLQPFLISGSTAHDNEKGNREGVLLDKTKTKQTVRLGGYDITFSHDGLLPWSAVAKDSIWPLTGAIIIQTGDNEFIVGGTGIFATFSSIDTSVVTNILFVDEGKFENKVWKPGRRLNGDEDHQGRHLRIPVNQWGLQKIKLYNTKIDNR
jgi:beta-galactosidase GanA